MAPIQPIEATWPNLLVLSILVTILLIMAMFFTLAMCCCDRGNDNGGYYSTNPNSPNYCPDCAYVARYGLPDPESARDDYRRGEPYRRRSPNYVEVGDRDKRRGGTARDQRSKSNRADSLREDSKTRAPTVPTVPSIKPGAKGGFSPATMAVGEDRMRAAQANPAYKTLFEAKSGVFDKRKGAQTTAVDESRMKAAQANPAYRTMWGVKSNVFDKAQGPQSTAPDEARMKAAQANPAYKTMWGVKSNIFEK